jgi:peroxiredoxin
MKRYGNKWNGGKKKYHGGLLGALLFLAGACGAQGPAQYGVAETPPEGLAVGAEAPSFSAVNQDGKTVSLAELRDKGPVVLFFYRGHWCPVCDKHLKAFVDSLPLLKQAGAQVVAVTPNAPRYLAQTDEKLQGQLSLLSDTSGQIMRAYEVLFPVTEAYQKKIRTFLGTDIARANDQQKAKLPVPATYLIDPAGEIRWRHFDLNYKNRAGVGQILAEL